VVYFSGFSDANKPYSLEFKNQLAKMVTDLGGEVRFDNEFNEHITHVVRCCSRALIGTHPLDQALCLTRART
jgi:hypothetical protein